MKRSSKRAGGATARRFLGYLRPFLGLFALGFLAMTLATLAKLAGPLILKALIDRAIPGKDIRMMLGYGASYLGIIIVMGALTYYQSVTIIKLGLNVVTEIKKDLFAHLLTLPVSYFDAHPVGELMARVENDTEKVKNLFSETGITLAANVVYYLGIIAVFFALDAKVAAWVILPTPFFLVGFFAIFDKLRPLYEASRKKYAEICAIATEFVQGIEVLKAFDRTGHASERLDAASLGKRNAEGRAAMLEYSAMGFMGFLGGPGFIALIIWLVAPGIFYGALTLGSLLVFIEYGQRMFEPLFSIGENIRGIQQARVALGRIFSILELRPEPSGTGAPPSFARAIEFRNVSFEYKPGETVLDGVSFTIEKGSTVALVGSSGSGKTTTVSLLARFHEPISGQIVVDGVPLSSISLRDWRRKIGLVLQDIYLFPGSILENVRVYDDGVGPEDAARAITTVDAKDFVDALPLGMDTPLHERGANLSTGEKQLLSFARAIAFGADIVIMDEATASVDVATEARIRRSLETLLEGRTAIIVAHRLSSILKADKILFFKDGRVIAQGRHDDLVESLPEYRELVRLQFPDLENQVEARL